MTKEQQECHRAFKTSTYEQFKNINPERLDGTCRWVVENPQYLDWWNNNHNDLLWISADPGCGKSVLAKSLIEIDFRRSDDRLAVCYFFFKDNDEQNSFTTALCAMLHQLFKVNPELIRHALPSWRENGIKLQYEVDELWRIFMDATSDPACCNTVCIFDGLDECQSNDRDKLISRLEKFYIETHLFNRGNWLKFLVTSRPYDEIRFALEPVTRSFPWIHLNGDQESEHMHEEISLVVKIRVAELAENLSEMLSVETRERLEKELLQMEHRTYLWLHLAMDNIRTTFQQSIRPDEESIQMVPKSVNAAYEKILNRAATNKESEVRTILQIIVGARRPLLIEEMAMALGLATFDTSLAIGGIGLNPKGLEDKIRQLCGLFVSIYDHRIFLIHQTATEFLVKRTDTEYSNSKWCFEQSDIESLMSTVCIKFLLMTDLDRSFWSYATAHWPYHVRQTSSRADMELLENLDQLYNQFYDASTGGYAAWFENLWREEGVHLDRPNLRPLHLAALIGHDLWIRKWKNLSRTSMK